MNPVPGLTHEWYRKVNPVRGINLLTFGVNSPLNAIDSNGNTSFGSAVLYKLFVGLTSLYMNLAEYIKEGLPCTDNPVAKIIEQQALDDLSSKYIMTLKNRMASGGKIPGTRIVVVTYTVIAVAEVDTTVLAAAAYAEVSLGVTSTDPLFANLDGYFQGLQGGDEAWGDLDATTAALQIGGYQSGASLASWGTLQELGDELQ
jgi:hypothetical protein